MRRPQACNASPPARTQLVTQQASTSTTRPRHVHDTSTTQHDTARHSTTQHDTAQHSTTQHSTAQHSTAQHSTAQHSTAQHSTARQGKAGQGRAGQGRAGQGTYQRGEHVPDRFVAESLHNRKRLEANASVRIPATSYANADYRDRSPKHDRKNRSSTHACISWRDPSCHNLRHYDLRGRR